MELSANAWWEKGIYNVIIMEYEFLKLYSGLPLNASIMSPPFPA